MNLSEALNFSVQSLRANPIRSMLTGLGMVIGTASVILVVTISLTSREYILEQIEGVDFTRRVTIGIRDNRYQAQVPTVTGPLRRRGSVHGFEAAIAREHT